MFLIFDQQAMDIPLAQLIIHEIHRQDSLSSLAYWM